jgi:hypothetical protein
MNQFLYGIDDELRQQRRDWLLGVTRSDLIHVAQQWLVPGLAQSNVAALGPTASAERVKSAAGWDVERL